MRSQSASLFDFDFYEPLPIQVEVSDAPLTSDAGLLPLRQFDQRIGLTSQFAAALHDPRDPDLIEHTFPEMVRSRVFGILAGYEDQNDHDTLRTDPTFKLIANRSPDDADLASQPTLSRFENQIDIPSLFRLRDVLIGECVSYNPSLRPANGRVLMPHPGAKRLVSHVRPTMPVATRLFWSRRNGVTVTP